MACYVSQSSCPSLLNLPLEIRLRIYDFVFKGSEIYVQLVGECPQDWRLHIHGRDLGIFLTSRQLYHEARVEWYTANIWTVGCPPALGIFLRSTSSKSLARVKHLTVQIYELPDLNTTLLPALRLLTIDFTTDLPSFMTGAWYDYDDEKIYSRFADEAIDRVHSTFKVLITQLHAEKRAFHIGLLVRNCCQRTCSLSVQRIELYVNLDTKTVERRTIDPIEGGDEDHCPEDSPITVKQLRAQSKLSTSSTWGPEHYREDYCHPSLELNRHKFPPGREGSFGEEDDDDRGSIRESEQESSCDDADEDDEEVSRIAKGTDWEAVKRIIEHPSEDEQNGSGIESEGEEEEEEEEEKEEGGEAEEEGKEEEEEDVVSESRRFKAEVDRELTGLILESKPINQGSEQGPVGSTDVFKGEETKTMVQVAAVRIGGDPPIEEGVTYNARWPE